LLLTGLLAGCGSSVGLGLNASAGSSASSSATAGMNMSGSSVKGTTAPEVNGIRPVAYRALATSYWQGMKIEAMTTTPTTFIVYNGTTAKGAGVYSTVRANRHESFHLMVMLSDQHTGVLIPYASVWATIYDAKGTAVFNERQWPMISAYMGSHYGNNVTLPGPGRYTLKLLITPPQVARHLEYANVWKSTHEVTASFTWKPAI
jgi:hypothetical protein